VESTNLTSNWRSPTRTTSTHFHILLSKSSTMSPTARSLGSWTSGLGLGRTNFLLMPAVSGPPSNHLMVYVWPLP
jgi:hypothetical protein